MPSTVPYFPNWDFATDPAPQDKVNASQLQSQFNALASYCSNLGIALSVCIQDDNTLTDSIVRLRNLHPEVLAAIASAGGWQPKLPATLATTGNITLSGEQTIDGVLTSDSRVLVKDQTLPAQNGIYITAAGAWTRAPDALTATDLGYAFLAVLSGAANAGSTWILTATAATITVGTTSLVFALVGPPTPVPYPAPRCARNLLGNPAFQVNQSAVSNNLAGTTATRSCDRWFAIATAGVAGAIGITWNGPSAFGSLDYSYYLAIDGDPLFSLAGVGDYVSPCYQAIEGPDIQPLGWGTADAKAAVVRFNAYAAIPGLYTVAIRNAAQTQSFVAEVALVSGYQSVKVSVPACFGGVWSTTVNTVGLDISIGVLSGPTLQSPTPGAWASGNYLSTATATNYLLLNATRLSLANVQLALIDEDGVFVTPDFNAEFARCQRYYRKSYNYTVPLTTAANTGMEVTPVAGATMTHFYSIRHQGMAQPSLLLIYSNATGIGAIRDLTAGADVAATTNQLGEDGTLFTWSATIGHQYAFQWAVLTPF